MTVFINILIAVAVLGVLSFLFGLAAAFSNGKSEGTQPEINASGSEKNEKLRAFIKCAGEESERRYTYVGAEDCFAASRLAGSYKSCAYSCLGLGSCADVCKYGAISTDNGLAVIDSDKCTGCGRCVAACPRGVIEMIPQDALYAVRCSNASLGMLTRKICDLGCIGCLACVKTCKYEAIEVKDSIAHIDYSKCTNCGECADVCPRGIITAPPIPEPEEEPFDESEYFELSLEEENETEMSEKSVAEE